MYAGICTYIGVRQKKGIDTITNHALQSVYYCSQCISVSTSIAP